jgi:hypothetical protein
LGYAINREYKSLLKKLLISYIAVFLVIWFQIEFFISRARMSYHDYHFGINPEFAILPLCITIYMEYLIYRISVKLKEYYVWRAIVKIDK